MEEGESNNECGDVVATLKLKYFFALSCKCMVRRLNEKGKVTAVVVVVVFNVVAVVVAAAPVSKQEHALDALAVLVLQYEET